MIERTTRRRLLVSTLESRESTLQSRVSTPESRVSTGQASAPRGAVAVITFTVATRVVFGHSGNLERLKARNGWLLIAVELMLFGMATRISGDFWPRIMASHYIYGAVIWTVGVLLWSSYVLPKIAQVEVE